MVREGDRLGNPRAPIVLDAGVMQSLPGKAVQVEHIRLTVFVYMYSVPRYVLLCQDGGGAG